MRDALRQLLPRGTSKAVVEEKLVKEGGATIHSHERRTNVFYYQRPVHCDPENTQWQITVMYDAHGNVWQIRAQGPPAFPEEPPSDRTDATIFSFDDYHTADDLAQTFHALFPLGTPKAQIDKVLVYWAMASPYVQLDEPGHVIYHYQFDLPATRENGVSHSHYGAWNVAAAYDSDNALEQIYVEGSSANAVFDHSEEGPYLRQKMIAYQKKKKENHQ